MVLLEDAVSVFNIKNHILNIFEYQCQLPAADTGRADQTCHLRRQPALGREAPLVSKSNTLKRMSTTDLLMPCWVPLTSLYSTQENIRQQCCLEWAVSSRPQLVKANRISDISVLSSCIKPRVVTKRISERWLRTKMLSSCVYSGEKTGQRRCLQLPSLVCPSPLLTIGETG